jgi:hypothetical protein
MSAMQDSSREKYCIRHISNREVKKMEMTPIDQRDKTVPLGDGATPHGRELSSTAKSTEERASVIQNPKDIVKREMPVDQTARSIAAMLRRADPNLDAQTAVDMAKRLLEGSPKVETSKDKDEPNAIGTTLDVVA